VILYGKYVKATYGTDGTDVTWG